MRLALRLPAGMTQNRPNLGRMKVLETWGMGLRMGRCFGRTWCAALLAAAAGALTACSSSMPDFAQFKLPDPGVLLPSNSSTYVPPVSARALKPIGPDDLVDGQGLCAGMATASQVALGSDAGTGSPPPSAVPRNVGLEMTECEVARAIGQPQSVNIGTNERGERKVVMTYSGNEHAGTYEFVAGRLTSLERGPEPPPQPAKPTKKPATAKQQNKKQPAT